MRASPPKTTPDQMAARKALVVKLVAFGLTLSMVRDAIREQTTPNVADSPDAASAKLRLREEIGAPLSEEQVGYAYKAAVDDLYAQYEQERGSSRALQSERLRRDLVELRRMSREEPRGKFDGRTKAYQAIAKHEEIIARIDGNYAPVKVEVAQNVQVRSSLLAVVAALSPEEQEELVQEQMRLEMIAGH